MQHFSIVTSQWGIRSYQESCSGEPWWQMQHCYTRACDVKVKHYDVTVQHHGSKKKHCDVTVHFGVLQLSIVIKNRIMVSNELCAVRVQRGAGDMEHCDVKLRSRCHGEAFVRSPSCTVTPQCSTVTPQSSGSTLQHPFVTSQWSTGTSRCYRVRTKSRDGDFGRRGKGQEREEGRGEERRGACDRMCHIHVLT